MELTYFQKGIWCAWCAWCANKNHKSCTPLRYAASDMGPHCLPIPPPPPPPPPVEITYFQKGNLVLGVQTKITKVVPPDGAYLFSEGDWCAWCAWCANKNHKSCTPAPPRWSLPIFIRGLVCLVCKQKSQKLPPTHPRWSLPTFIRGLVCLVCKQKSQKLTPPTPDGAYLFS